MKSKASPQWFCVAAALVLGSCQNTAFIGHEESIAVAAQYKPDPAEPVDIHVGYKDRLSLAVPPKQGQHLGRLLNPDHVPKGELLSTISVFQVTRPEGADGKPLKGSLDVYTGLATGLAATNVTASDTSQKVVNVPATQVSAAGAVTEQSVVATVPVAANAQQVKSTSKSKATFSRASSILNSKSREE